MRPTWMATRLPWSPYLSLMRSQGTPGWNLDTSVPVGMVIRFLHLTPLASSSPPMHDVGVTTTSILLRTCLRYTHIRRSIRSPGSLIGE